MLVHILDDKLREGWAKYYIMQAFLAFIVFFTCLLFLAHIFTGILVAAIGASAFIVFAIPRNTTATPRAVIFGHAICGLVGGGAFLVDIFPDNPPVNYAFKASLAFFLGFFLMVITDTEHPPAASTAVGFAIDGFKIDAYAFVIFAAVLLALSQILLKKYLRDLT